MNDCVDECMCLYIVGGYCVLFVCILGVYVRDYVVWGEGITCAVCTVWVYMRVTHCMTVLVYIAGEGLYVLCVHFGCTL